jgi:hypothetical protein
MEFRVWRRKEYQSSNGEEERMLTELAHTTIPSEAPREEQVFAFDVPLHLSADEAARFVDDLCPNGFFPWQLVVWPGAGTRVFCKRSKASGPGELVAARLKAAEAGRRAKDAEDALADTVLRDILAADPRIKPGIARARLARFGYRRGNDWVAEAMTRAKTAR